MRLWKYLLLTLVLVSTTSTLAQDFTCDIDLGDKPGELTTVGGVGDSARFRDYSVIRTGNFLLVFDPLSQKIVRKKISRSRCIPDASLGDVNVDAGGFVVRVGLAQGVLYGLLTSGEVTRLKALDANTGQLSDIDANLERGPSDSATIEHIFSQDLPPLPGAPGAFVGNQDDGNLLEAGQIGDLTRSYTFGIAGTADQQLIRYDLVMCTSGQATIRTADGLTGGQFKGLLSIAVPNPAWLGTVSILNVQSATSFQALYSWFSVSAAGIIEPRLSLATLDTDGKKVIRDVIRGAGNAVSVPTAVISDGAETSSGKMPVVAYLVSVNPGANLPKREILRIAPLKVAGASRPAELSSECTASNWIPVEHPLSTLNSVQRKIIERAEEFIYASWCVKPENIRSLGSCTAPYDKPELAWKQPTSALYLRPGVMATGIFYLWGGKKSAKSILQRYGVDCQWPAATTQKTKDVAVAGNVCTNAKGNDNPAASGIDCSGFVGQAWSLARSLSTSELSKDPKKFGAAVVTNQHELRIGDALLYRVDKSGHVRLFGGWVVTPTGLRVRVYESTTESICSGTCLRDIDIAQLAGYQLIGLQAIRNAQGQ